MVINNLYSFKIIIKYTNYNNNYNKLNGYINLPLQNVKTYKYIRYNVV